jgi:hypothetical protein
MHCIRFEFDIRNSIFWAISRIFVFKCSFRILIEHFWSVEGGQWAVVQCTHVPDISSLVGYLRTGYWVPSTHYVRTKIFDSNSIFDDFWISNIHIRILLSNSNQILSLQRTVQAQAVGSRLLDILPRNNGEINNLPNQDRLTSQPLKRPSQEIKNSKQAVFR